MQSSLGVLKMYAIKKSGIAVFGHNVQAQWTDHCRAARLTRMMRM